jgi:hypothetical protein
MRCLITTAALALVPFTVSSSAETVARWFLRGLPRPAVVAAVEDNSAPAASRAAASRRSFPDTSTRIAILADQLPGSMTTAQRRFAATHYVGTQKLTRDLSQPLRAINPNFLVLHYHLAMWQSAPGVTFIVDGRSWGNDYPTVNRYETWFWHNAANRRVASNQDGKLLMNIADPGFRKYWRDSIADQVRAGDYDAVFLDSASPNLLQWEARAPADPRLSGTGVRDNIFPELGDKSWIAAWQDWIKDLDGFLAERGIPLIPNAGSFVTTWDDTDYSLTAGIFAEGFSDPTFTTTDWKSAVNQMMALVAKSKIVILQNYLESESNLVTRKYLLANYLLVKGSRTYLFYFSKSTLQWYPEWALDLGAAETTAATVDNLLVNGVYRRDFAKGFVLVNPTTDPVSVDLGATFRRVELSGGGAVPASGAEPGRIATTNVTSVKIAPKAAEILLR